MSPKKPKKASARTKKAGMGKRQPRRKPMDVDVELEALLRLVDLERPKSSYQGQLKKPIARAPKAQITPLGAPDEQERLVSDDDVRIALEQMEKLFLLLNHFKIPENSQMRWFLLALQLARQYVPGMKVTTTPGRRRGRKPKWGGPDTDIKFLAWLYQIDEVRDRGIADAISILRKSFPDSWGKYTDKALHHRYDEIRKRVRVPDGDLIDNLKTMFAPPTTIEKPDNS